MQGERKHRLGCEGNHGQKKTPGRPLVRFILKRVPQVIPLEIFLKIRFLRVLG